MSRSSFPPLEDDFTRALLRSAEADEPSNAAYAKAATALGVGAGVGLGASLAAPSALAAGAAGAARWSGATAVRLAALGVSGALLVGGGALLLHAHLSGAANGSHGAGKAIAAAAPLVSDTPGLSDTSDGTSVAVARAASDGPAAALIPARVESAPLPVASNAASSATDASRAPRAAIVPSVAALPAGSSPAAAPAAVVAFAGAHPGSARGPVATVRRSVPLHFSGSAQGASSGSSLAEQVQSLDRARVALGSGDASSALREITHYRKAWPRGVFLTEASVLEIEALAARGERSLAALRAQAFVTAHPDSPQAGRLRALIPVEKR